MLCAMPLYLLCWLTKEKVLNSTLMKQLADKVRCISACMHLTYTETL